MENFSRCEHLMYLTNIFWVDFFVCVSCPRWHSASLTRCVMSLFFFNINVMMAVAITFLIKAFWLKLPQDKLHHIWQCQGLETWSAHADWPFLWTFMLDALISFANLVISSSFSSTSFCSFVFSLFRHSSSTWGQLWTGGWCFFFFLSFSWGIWIWR